MCLYDYLVKFWLVGANCKSWWGWRSFFLPVPGLDGWTWSWEAGGNGAVESPLAVSVSVGTATDWHPWRWNTCLQSKQTPSPPTKGCKCQAQTFPLLKLTGMPAPVKNTNTQAEKKSLPYSKLGRAQPLTFTWANKRNIPTLPSWKCTAYTEVTSICLISIQVCLHKTVHKKPLQKVQNQMLSFQPSSQQ